MPPLYRAGWVGRAHHRAKKVVANRETIGQGVIVGNVCARVVAHAQYGVVGINRKTRTDKTVHCTAVPALMLRHPVVRDVMRAGCIRCGGVQVEWQECPHGGDRCVHWVGLMESPALISISAAPTSPS